MQTQATTTELEKIFKKFKVNFAYQFGSSINGNQTKDSDIDIAVDLDKKFNKNQRFEVKIMLANELSKALRKPIDLVILNDLKSLFFKYTIFKEGKLIYSTPKEDHIDFECRTMSLFFDFQPFLDLYNKNYVKEHSK